MRRRNGAWTDTRGARIYASANGFGEAAEHLEDGAGPPIRDLRVSPLWNGSPVVSADRDALARDFRRFVAALGRTTEEGGGRVVRGITLSRMDWRATPEHDTARLLGQVLTAHPTLEEIEFDDREFSVPHWQLFTASVSAVSTPATRLATLEFRGRPLDRERAQAIADMVSRNVPVSDLSIVSTLGGGLDAVSCKIICRSVSKSQNLRRLCIDVKELFDDTLDNVAASSSPLQDLYVAVDIPISNESLASVAKQLRTNTTMTRLFLVRLDGDNRTATPINVTRPIEEVLETYNFTLRTVEVSPPTRPRPAAQARIDELLARNEYTKYQLSILQGDTYHYRGAPDPPRLLIAPRVLARSGKLPTLLYRYLRRFEASDLCHLLRPNEGINKKKRGRATTV